jgi:hypothetical protein
MQLIVILIWLACVVFGAVLTVAGVLALWGGDVVGLLTLGGGVALLCLAGVLSRAIRR